MSTEILKNVKGTEFPRTWVKKLHLHPDQVYDIEVKSSFNVEKTTTTKKKRENFDVTKDPLFLIEGYDIAIPPESSTNIDKDLYSGSQPA